MEISIAPLARTDAAAVVAAEDEEMQRWLTGGQSTVLRTEAYIDALEENARAGASKRAFAIRVDGKCVGTVDFDAEVTDGLEPGDVNIAYGVAPWMRGRGVASRAVELVCEVIRERGVGRRAVIRTDERNPASARVAERAGFRLVGVHESTEEVGEDGSPVRFRVHVLDLG